MLSQKSLSNWNIQLSTVVYIQKFVLSQLLLHTLSLHAPLHPVRFHISTTTFCNNRSLFALLFSLEFQTDIQHYCIRMHVCIIFKKSPATKLTMLWKFRIINSFRNCYELVQFTYLFLKYSFFANDIPIEIVLSYIIVTKIWFIKDLMK